MTEKAANLDREALAQDWRARGFSCDMWTSPPGTAWTGYINDSDEIICLVRGEVEIEIAGEIQVPAVGAEVLIPARTRHSVRNTGTTHATWLYGYRLS